MGTVGTMLMAFVSGKARRRLTPTTREIRPMTGRHIRTTAHAHKKTKRSHTVSPSASTADDGVKIRTSGTAMKKQTKTEDDSATRNKAAWRRPSTGPSATTVASSGRLAPTLVTGGANSRGIWIAAGRSTPIDLTPLSDCPSDAGFSSCEV